MNKLIAFLTVAAALMLSSCARRQLVWLDAPPAGAEAEARMVPAASGITPVEPGEMLRSWLPPPSLWASFSGGYLSAEEATGGNRDGVEIQLGVGAVGGRSEALQKLIRLNAIFLESKGDGSNFFGIGLGYGTFLPHIISPYVLLEGMLGYANADSELVGALIPEIGVKFWIPMGGSLVVEPNYLPIGVGARYFLGTQGRDDDFWLFDVSMTWVLGL